MHRRALLATPPAALAAAALPAAARAQAQAPQIATEEFMVPAQDAGIETEAAIDPVTELEDEPESNLVTEMAAG